MEEQRRVPEHDAKSQRSVMLENGPETDLELLQAKLEISSYIDRGEQFKALLRLAMEWSSADAGLSPASTASRLQRPQ